VVGYYEDILIIPSTCDYDRISFHLEAATTIANITR